MYIVQVVQNRHNVHILFNLHTVHYTLFRLYTLYIMYTMCLLCLMYILYLKGVHYFTHLSLCLLLQHILFYILKPLDQSIKGPYYSLFTVHCSLYTVHCILYYVYCKLSLCPVHCTVHIFTLCHRSLYSSLHIHMEFMPGLTFPRQCLFLASRSAIY